MPNQFNVVSLRDACALIKDYIEEQGSERIVTVVDIQAYYWLDKGQTGGLSTRTVQNALKHVGATQQGEKSGHYLLPKISDLPPLPPDTKGYIRGVLPASLMAKLDEAVYDLAMARVSSPVASTEAQRYLMLKVGYRGLTRNMAISALKRHGWTTTGPGGCWCAPVNPRKPTAA